MIVLTMRHLVITVYDQTILHEKFKFSRVVLCYTVASSMRARNFPNNNSYYYELVSWGG